MINLIAGILLAYGIGSIPSGYIIAKKVKGIDIRTEGSGNVGATNVFRTVGKAWGIGALISDMLKGVVAVILIPLILPVTLMPLVIVKICYGFFAVAGHNWPVFLQFKGGKGVATTCGVILGIFPCALGMSVLWFILVVTLTRYISLGSIIAAVLFPFHFWLFNYKAEHFLLLLMITISMAGVIVYRHRSNIQRLFAGTEHKIQFKSAKC